ncbi:asparagine synthetase B family protein [Thiohalophilus sp.]|uniref:asparagine synthetase B family protein n=1 Tax=Thiohalophilus sp. TaxID=3028392 RepID=UPI002ACD7668|nr:asparagine synthase-related protein [Thiohalophilus sp.]MDZ7803476.1 asparagine synthase-related protein [Thiohalophilus sp.]
MQELDGWFITDGSPGPGEAPLSDSHSPNIAATRLSTRGGACQVHGGWIASDAEGRLAAVIGHPGWREPAASPADPARTLLVAYQQHGAAVLERLGGDFALAILDPVENRLLAGIDRLGQWPLYFSRITGGVAFSTSLARLPTPDGQAREPTADGLFHYLFFHMLPAPVSLYAGVEKLQSAHCLRLGQNTLRVEPYWLPRFEEPAQADIATLGGQLRQHLGDSVKRLAEPAATGAFLSGGLDSSSVAGMLAAQRPGQADTFSIGFDAPGYDEIAYARLATDHFGTRPHEYYVTPEDVVEAVPLIAENYDEPFGNSSALPAYFCARLAADAGMTRLLAGDGGDELFAGNARYAKQGVFELWYRQPALARRLLEPLLTRLPRQVPLLGKARSYVEQARIPLPDRLQTYNYLHRLPLAEMFDPGFLEQVNTDDPWDLMRGIYRRPENASTLNRMMYLDWQQTLADNDLRKVSRMCHLAGVEVVYPMLDDTLVEFACRVPSTLKLHKGRLRHFYKEAMSGFLPDEIIDKKKHGFGLPFGVWMQEHAPLRELAYDGLLRFKQRGIIRPAFIDRLITLHREGHAAYYGELVWVLMMLDLWLETHHK